MKPMKWAVAFAAAAVAGPACAITLNLTSTPGLISGPLEQPAYAGSVGFDPYLLRAGDTITVNVTFTDPIVVPRLNKFTSHAFFNVHYYQTIDNGSVMFSTPFGYFGDGTGFTLQGSAIYLGGPYNGLEGFNLDSLKQLVS